MKKRFLSFLLAVVMVVSLLPTMAFAATTTTVSTSWSDLATAIDEAAAGDTIMLGADLSAQDGNSPLEIAKPLTLDLNGYMLDANFEESCISSILVLAEGADLTIQSSANPSAKAHDIYSCNGWTVNLGHWVTSKPDGYDEEAAADKKHAVINDGLITGVWGEAAVYVGGGAKCTLESGTIAGNVADNDGGGVFVDEGGTFVMNGGTVSYNDANYGGGVAVGSRWTSVDYGEFVLNGGTISNNTASSGGGVYVSTKPDEFTGPYFTMTGGTVSDNESYGYGGGVALEDCDGYTHQNFISNNPTTIMKMTGGAITNNYCGTYGGGVFFCAEFAHGFVTLGGTAVISGNWCGDRQDPQPGDPADNFYIGGDDGLEHEYGPHAQDDGGDGYLKFDAENAPKSGMNVGITLLTETGALMNPVEATGTLAAALTNINSYFHPDDLNYQVKCTVEEGDTTTYQVELADADKTLPLFDPRTGTGMVLDPDTGIPTTNPTRDGFKFLGWYDEFGDQIHDGTDFVGDYEEFAAGSVYYAYWEKLLPPTFILWYDYTEWDYVEWEDCVLGANNVPTTIPKKEGYKFLGWFNADEDEVDAKKIHTGKSFVSPYTQFEYNTTYYAHWGEDIPAKFYVNGVQLTGDDLDEDSLPKNLKLTHDYCAFGGWYDAATGGNKVHDGEKFVGTYTEFGAGESYYARLFVLDKDGKATDHIPLDQALKFSASGGKVTIGANGAEKAVADVAEELSRYGITASWKAATPSKWTITLENACISVTEGMKYTTNTYADIVTAATTDFVLNGKNTITANTNATMTPSAFTGIFSASKALTFSGEGSLLVDLSGVTGSGVVKRGIWAYKNTLTNSSTLTTKGTNKAGVSADNGLTNSGTITATDTACGVFTSDNKALTNNGGTIIGTASEGYRGVRVGGALTVNAGSVTGISGGQEGYIVGVTTNNDGDSCGVYVKGNIIVADKASVTGEVSGDAAVDARGVHAGGTIKLDGSATISGKANAKLPTDQNHNYGVSTGSGFVAVYCADNTKDDVLTGAACNLEPTDKTQPVVVSATAPTPSTYELVVTPPKSSTLNQACEASVQLKTKETKNTGYTARIDVAVTGPEGSTPSVKSGEQDLVTAKRLGDESFTLTKAYDKTYPLSLTFDKIGDYTVTFTVVDVNGTEGSDTICTNTLNITVSKPAFAGKAEITGVAQTGQTLTAKTSDLSDSTNVAYQWYRCDSADADGTPIDGATKTTYAPTAADHNKFLKFRVTATAASAYGGYISSEATEAVKIYSTYAISMTVKPLSKDVTAGVATEADWASFTIAAQQVNELDYESVRLKVEVTASPKDATATIYETADGNKTNLVGGFWKPDGMVLAKDYNTATPITLLFDTAGDYTVKLTLVNKNDSDAEICSLEKKITVEKPYLDGTVAIDGTAIVGETLTANVEALSDTTNLTFEWWRFEDDQDQQGSKIKDEKGKTYTLTADDRGKCIKAIASATDASLYRGSVRSELTEKVKQHTEYTLDAAVPESVAVNEPTDPTKTSFTIAAKTQYDMGYDSVRVKVEVTTPAGATAKIFDTEAPSTNLVGGFWKPDGMTLATDYNAATPITLLFDTAGDYTVKLSLVDKNRNDAVICSEELSVSAQEHSTYQFTSALPTTCGAGQDCSGIFVAVAADTVKDVGYDKARINVEVTKKPDDAVVKLDGQELQPGSYLGSADGFALAKDGSKSEPLALNFDKTGDYTVKFTLVNLNNSGAVICEATTNITVKTLLTGTVTAAGSACVGEKLTATLSEDFADKTNLTYQWYRCETADAAGTPIKVATNKEYTLTQNDLGQFLKVIVTATSSSDFGGTVSSAAAGIVKLQFTGKPTITIGQGGEHPPYFGQTIMASIANTGVLDKDDLVLYQWFRCDSPTSEGTPIPGATADRYTPTEDDLGKYIRVQITGKENCKYGGPVISGATEAAKRPPEKAPTITGTPIATATTVTLPVSGDPGTYEWSTDGKTWNDGNVLTDLEPAKEYTCYIRVKGTETTMPSEIAQTTVSTINAKPAEGEGYSISYREFMPYITIQDGYEVSTSSDFASKVSNGDGLVPGTTYYVRKAADTFGASDATKFEATEQPKVIAVVESSNTKGGSVKAEGDNIKDSEAGLGSSVKVTATPSSGYKFDGWYDGTELVSTENPYTFEVTGLTTLTAKFVIDKEKVETAPVSQTRGYDGTETTLAELKGEHHYTLTCGSVILNAGAYTITAKLESGYVWEDNTTANKTFVYTITKESFNTLPTGVAVEGTTVSGVTAKMEWRKSTDSSYTQGTGEPLDLVDLGAGTYYVRMKGDENCEYGKDLVIVIKASVITEAPTEIGSNCAMLNGSSTEGTVSYQYRKTGSTSWLKSSTGILNGLSADTEYEFCAVRDGVQGEIMSFRTLKATEPTGTISVKVTGPEGRNVTITVEKGNTVVSSKKGVISSSGGLDADVSKLADGYYNLVVSTDVGYTETRLLSLKGGESITAEIEILDAKLSSTVEVQNGAPKVAVDNLAGLISSAEKEAAVGGAKSVSVVLEVEEKKNENSAEGSAQIKALTEGQTIGAILDMSLFKTTTVNGSTTREDIGSEDNPVLEIVIPFDTNHNDIQMYRYHNGLASKLWKLNERPTSHLADGTFFVADGYIFLYSDSFSTYAIGYEKEQSSYSGGMSSNAIELPLNIENGKVEVSPENASAGQTVTLTATPDKGFTLETLTVLDKNGKEIEVKNLGNNKYSFTMPSGKVSISATFMEDNTMLNFFVDVKATDYFYDAVLWAAENGITKGTDDVHFSPDMGTTRAQVVTFLWRAAGCPEPTGSAGKFADVEVGSYYEKAVAWAIEQGVTKGTSDTTFSPDMVCTRGQIVTFLARFAGVEDADTASVFSDVKTTDYFAAAVKWAKDNKVTEGTSATTFSPNTDCTRAQVVTFLYRWMVK